MALKCHSHYPPPPPRSPPPPKGTSHPKKNKLWLSCFVILLVTTDGCRYVCRHVCRRARRNYLLIIMINAFCEDYLPIIVFSNKTPLTPNFRMIRLQTVF